MLIPHAFRGKKYFQNGIASDVLSSHRALGGEFMRQLEHLPPEFVEFINNKEQVSLSELQKISLVHLVLIHSNKFHDIFQQLRLNLRCDDSWICQSILVPYQNFIRKVIHSSELYEKIRIINNAWNNDSAPHPSLTAKSTMRANPKNFFNLELMYYTINLLTQLFSFLKHVPNIGRYYLHKSRATMEAFVEIASYQAVLCYFALKFMINEIIFRYDRYISTPEEGQAFRDILIINLESINQQMKNTLLNKYFRLIQKGIKIPIFELDRQSEQNLQLLQRVIGSQTYTRITTQRGAYNKNRKALAKKIFKEGKFDENLFEESVDLMGSSRINEEYLQQILNKQNYGGLNRVKEVCVASKIATIQQTPQRA